MGPRTADELRLDPRPLDRRAQRLPERCGADVTGRVKGSDADHPAAERAHDAAHRLRAVGDDPDVQSTVECSRLVGRGRQELGPLLLVGGQLDQYRRVAAGTRYEMW